MMMWLGTGRVWSLEMMTQFFFPFANSLNFGLPIGLASASATSSASDFGALYSWAWETRTPATCSSGSSSLIFSLPKGKVNVCIVQHPFLVHCYLYDF